MHQMLRLTQTCSLQADHGTMAEIQGRYGNQLYAKHDYDAAVAQHVATIDYMEPSYVVRKFLDARCIHNLTSYLKELHVQESSFYNDISKPHSLAVQLLMSQSWLYRALHLN